MGRGVNSGGGQSSLGYPFGDGGAPAPKSSTSTVEAPPQNPSTVVSHVQEKVQAVAPPATATTKQIPAGVHGNQTNNYLRADGQNCGNFLTDRPSTKVHAALWWWFFLGIPFWRWLRLIVFNIQIWIVYYIGFVEVLFEFGFALVCFSHCESLFSLPFLQFKLHRFSVSNAQLN